MRLPFFDVFRFDAERLAFSPRVRVRIGDVELDPGSPLDADARPGGLDVWSAAARELEVEVRHGVYVIRGAY